MKVIGWTHWDDFRFRDCEPSSDEENLQRKRLIAEELRSRGYKFNGYYHQSDSDAAFGVPVFDDGTVYQCTFRTWGGIMAMAYPDEIDNNGRYAYTDWAWWNENQQPVYPTWEQMKNDYGFEPAGSDM